LKHLLRLLLTVFICCAFLFARCDFSEYLSQRNKAMKINDVPQSGSVAGVTSSRNRSGQYRRTRAVPVNPNTASQTIVRSNLANLAAAWRTLTGEQQLGWVAYADAHPRTNPLGVTYKLTGMQAYVGVNGELLSAGLATVAAAPTSVSPDALFLSVGDDTDEAMTAEVDGISEVPALTWMVTQVSPPRSRGVLYNSDFRTVQLVGPTDTTNSNLTEEIAAKFGAINVTKRYFCRKKFVHTDGQSGPWSNVIMFNPTAAP
jgi:hypothetical protein